MSASGQLETIQPNSRRSRFTLNSALDGSPPIRSFDLSEVARSGAMVMSGFRARMTLKSPSGSSRSTTGYVCAETYGAPHDIREHDRHTMSDPLQCNHAGTAGRQE